MKHRVFKGRLAACDAEDHFGFPVNTVKNDGRRGRKNGTRAPYAEGDFDAMFVFLTSCSDADINARYFFVIPSSALLEHGVLRNDANKGKSAIVCYLPGYTPPGRGRPPNPWTQKYCFDLQDPDVHANVAAILEAYLPATSA